MCRAVTVISTHHAVKAGTEACGIEASGCPGTWDSRSATPVPPRLLECMGWEEKAVGGCSQASTKIGSQPPASPARLPTHPTLPPSTEDPGKTPTSTQQARIPGPSSILAAAAPLLLVIDPSTPAQSFSISPLLPSRRNDNNSRAPLLRLLTLASTTTTAASPRAPRDAVTITSTPPYPPSMQTGSAYTRTTNPPRLQSPEPK